MIKVEIEITEERLKELFEDMEIKYSKLKLKKLKNIIDEDEVVQETLEEEFESIIEEIIEEEWGD